VPGDIILAYDGQALESIQGLIQMVSSNKPATLTLFGTGGIRDIMISPENGKIGVTLDYKNLTLNREYILQYGY